MKKVLLIDDMKTVLAQASRILQDRYVLSVCDCAEDAPELIREDNPDIILVDMYLESDGAYRLLEFVRNDEALKDIPVLFTGCDVSVMALSKAFSLGVADFVKKPFTENIVFKKIEEQLRLSETGYRYDS
ncbi:MAG: response regulator [Lachnospiraceae bacterium]|nr:response regulator [Lachnospiraceae bacterium]